MPKERIPRKQLPQKLDILPRTLIKPRRPDDLLRLGRREVEVPLPRAMRLGPLLDLGEVATGVRRRQPREYSLAGGDIDVEWDRGDVGVAHDGLAEGVDAVVCSSSQSVSNEQRFMSEVGFYPSAGNHRCPG